jgi:hypothetical protein
MKNRFYLIILLLPTYLLMSYSSGAPVGKTGSVGDGGNTCATTGCHTTDGVNYSPNIFVSGFPSNGYEPGHTYRINLQTSGVSNSVTGFECVMENSSNRRMGAFNNINGNTQTAHNNEYITHTSAGTASHSWLFDWTAPATSQGNLTFYYAINFADGTGNTDHDYVQTGSLVVNENTTGLHILSDDLVKIYPNPTVSILHIDAVENIKSVSILDINGKRHEILINNNQVDVSSLPVGNYFLHLETENVKTVKQFIKK